MKFISHVLLMALVFGPCGVAAAAPLSGTAGSNLTAYNPGGGAISNNEWNSMINSRSSGVSAPATADFGNCNSVILRCASPKCANGGCTSIEVATPIVAGCVASNAACKQYGDELTQYIAAQLVASSTAKNNAQIAAAQSAAAQQSAEQMQQMQAQMQQMQQDLANQNAQQIAELQSALAEQQRATEAARAEAQAAADAAAAQANAPAASTPAAATSSAALTAAPAASSGATPTTVMEGLSEAQRIAANAGVSADILAREQVAGQIMTSLENAEKNLKDAKAAMQNAFTYAGCTTNGDNCVGPKRVSVFRQKAMAFFDPYDAVLDELYDALITAQSVGVDITDIYMMLNGSCNVWGEYLCYDSEGDTKAETTYQMVPTGQKCKTVNGEQECETTYERVATTSSASRNTYTSTTCGSDGKSKASQYTRGGVPCTVGAVIPPEDSPACTLNRTVTDMEVVQRNFLFSDAGDTDEHVRIGCASSALESSKFFRNRKKGSSIDIETLQRMVSQDAPAIIGSNKYTGGSSTDAAERYKYCALTSTGYANLERAVATKKLPAKVCVKDNMLRSIFESNGRITAATFDKLGLSAGGDSNPDYTTPDICNRMGCEWAQNQGSCRLPNGKKWENGACVKQ